ncbi:alpha-glucosidase [Catalinimonas alkaloidigena]|uniref:Alpha-glucosidase n=1 Tax=Catalinimonas alkaloidigena TaxID=1075417 RepID=A0A1G9UCD5_9BACT|nr:alpha-amylase family glycosyl hydrolase [Catalinimonas alkaloidigena]SDM57610.1 alpha-glucosidase [Catalinimonas alkaloidigena]
MSEAKPSLDVVTGPEASAPVAWWQHAVVYQIYPRSFQDSNGDGVGDLPGITQRLDYLRWLGVDAIWISPIYPSPMADFGYDVTDYTGIEPMFGTLHDFDHLVEEAHRRHLKVILDYVPNHTSIEHPWFQESRSSRDHPKRDWYLWKDPGVETSNVETSDVETSRPDGGPPTNWVSNFGGHAWSLDPQTGQYYYHAYLPEQPDLNWRNPAVQEAMFDALRFWLDRGVDGFRVDALRQMIKDDQWRDNPPSDEGPTSQNPYDALKPLYTTDRPEVMDLVRKMRRILDEYGARTGMPRVLIGELYLRIERLVAYYGEDGEGCQLPFNFHLISTPWKAPVIADLIQRYEAALPPHGWPNWVLGNHDQHRLATRLGAAQTRIAAMLLLTLRGTPTLYYGDEIGMPDVPIPEGRVQDPWEKRVPGRGLGRDPERTPMQWDNTKGAGFTTEVPWLPLADDFEQRNVAVQRKDHDSILSLYHRLIQLRRRTSALHRGAYDWVKSQGHVLAYQRSAEDQAYLIVLNLGDQPAAWNVEGTGKVAVGTHRQREGEGFSGTVTLAPNEGVVVRMG